VTASAELERRLQNTRALITRYEQALSSPEGADYKASLTINLRSLQKLRRRLEADGQAAQTQR
jgi:hypothetical protein